MRREASNGDSRGLAINTILCCNRTAEVGRQRQHQLEVCHNSIREVTGHQNKFSLLLEPNQLVAKCHSVVSVEHLGLATVR